MERGGERGEEEAALEVLVPYARGVFFPTTADADSKTAVVVVSIVSGLEQLKRPLVERIRVEAVEFFFVQ